MARVKSRDIRRWIAAWRRRRRNPVLSRPLSQICDRKIDIYLESAGLKRADLFTPRNAIARHRVWMAHMLNARGIDVGIAVTHSWQELKNADGKCARCTQRGRCRRWLEWGRDSAAPELFCPNARLFTAIGANQARRYLSLHLS